MEKKNEFGAEDMLQSFFDLTIQYKALEKRLKTMRADIIELLKVENTKSVSGGIIKLRLYTTTAYRADLFDALDIEQIKLCAKFSVPAIRKEGLIEVASPYLIKKPEIPAIYCITQEVKYEPK
jgi:hypothetical protein